MTDKAFDYAIQKHELGLIRYLTHDNSWNRNPFLAIRFAFDDTAQERATQTGGKVVFLSLTVEDVP